MHQVYDVAHNTAKLEKHIVNGQEKSLWRGVAEEAGGAYKNVDDVVEATETAGLSKRVVRLVPLGNIKG